MVEATGGGRHRVLVTYGPFEFPGEMGLLTGRRANLTCVASQDGRVLRVPPGQVQVIGAGVPLFLETSRPGVFCVGDARSRSVKRVATAIADALGRRRPPGAGQGILGA